MKVIFSQRAPRCPLSLFSLYHLWFRFQTYWAVKGLRVSTSVRIILVQYLLNFWSIKTASPLTVCSQVDFNNVVFSSQKFGALFFCCLNLLYKNVERFCARILDTLEYFILENLLHFIFYTENYEKRAWNFLQDIQHFLNWLIQSQPAKLQKKKCRGVHFFVYGIIYCMPIQQKLTPPCLLYTSPSPRDS